MRNKFFLMALAITAAGVALGSAKNEDKKKAIDPADMNMKVKKNY